MTPVKQSRLDQLARELRSAPTLTVALVLGVAAGACSRVPVLQAAGRTVRFQRLLNAGGWVDDIVGASHDVAALAILAAFLEARRIAPEESPTAPRVRPWSGMPAVCENFA